jgi:hypothetical protein
VTAGVRFANAGDPVVLQRFAAGAWRRIREGRLDQDHLVAFTVPVPSREDQVYRVVLLATADHATSVSGPVRVPRAARADGR